MSTTVCLFLRAILIATFVSPPLSSGFTGERKTILCTISYTYDSKGTQTGETVGEHVFTFTTQSDGSTGVELGECRKLTKFIETDHEYVIACDLTIGSSLYKKLYSINRYSGAYEEIFARDGSKDYLMHRGKCEETSRKF
jgi:hypothetical protein